jgi:hypothetical protein
MFGNLGQQQLNSALGIDTAAQQALQTATQIGGAGRIPEYGNGGPTLGGGLFHGLGQGLQYGGLNMIGGGIDNWMQKGFDSPQLSPSYGSPQDYNQYYAT